MLQPHKDMYLRGAKNHPWEQRSLDAVCLAGQATSTVEHEVPSDPPPERDMGERGLNPSTVGVPAHPQPGCGIYALKDEFFGDFQQASGAGYVFQVHGFVELGGKIIAYQYGYRAAQARMLPPLTLSVPCRSIVLGMYPRVPVPPCGHAAWIVHPDAHITRGVCDDHYRDSYGDRVSVDAYTEPLMVALSRLYGLDVVAGWR